MKHTKRARELHRNSTDAESKFWSMVRNRQFQGLKFRRQVPVQGFIADFVCYEKRLIVELDGGQHADQTARDEFRTNRLHDAGYRVLRFWNNDILTNPDGVWQALESAVEHQKAPLPGGEGLG
ncbi:endonuclease domain-containing protein [Pacificispira sp.]|uniref:endonuclease domain-containing protein n=1 Tax=Pacificispira sp. TaxID=2888761 RepID=UPI003B52ACE8